MVIGILKELKPETRVAVIPESLGSFKDNNVRFVVENGAGQLSNFSDSEYSDAGAVIAGRDEILKEADILPVVGSPGLHEISLLKERAVVAGCLNPFYNKDLVNTLAGSNITSFSMELLPRTTIAQSMDVLSSMAMISGYKAVIEAAMTLPRFFPMFITAAGTVRPARVLIIGAGVAGLQAIATARRLGAVVEVFDVRSAVREEVLSLGGRFIQVEGAKEDVSAGGYAIEQTEDFLKKQSELIHRHAVKSDVIICTAQIQGKKAPVLITRETVEAMSPGTVIIDLAASTGGNCELTGDHDKVSHNGVTIVGQSGYPSLMPSDASRLYSHNILSFLKLVIAGGERAVIDMNDEIIARTCLTHGGTIVNSRIKQLTDGSD